MKFYDILFLFTCALAVASTPSPGSANSLLPSSSYDTKYERPSELPEHDGGGHGGGEGGGGGGHSGGDSEGSSGSGTVAGSGGGSGGSTGDGSKMSNGILSLSLASVGLATLAIRVLFL